MRMTLSCEVPYSYTYQRHTLLERRSNYCHPARSEEVGIPPGVAMEYGTGAALRGQRFRADEPVRRARVVSFGKTADNPSKYVRLYVSTVMRVL
jgi:hypothetical protein